ASGGASAGRGDGMDQGTSAAGSQRGQKRSGAALGTQVPGVSDQPAREDRSSPAECGAVESQSQRDVAKLPKSEQRQAARPMARVSSRLVGLLRPGRRTPQHL